MQSLRARTVIGLFAAFVLVPCSVGCGGETGGNAGGGAGVATASDLDGFCNAQCAHSAKCDPQNAMEAGACRDSCIGDLGNLATAVRSDIVRSLTTCYTALECGKNDDGCLADAVVATGGQVDAALHAPDVSSCLQKERECRETSTFSDDTCGTLVALIATRRAEAARCFTLSCEALGPCLTPIFGD